nr:DNA-directed primase/polymerase protein-like [Quercus suber]
MVYSMSRNRYCERIGRQHKSNHVMYIVDLRRAVYYQKCYDPDCRGYRSPLRPIPIDVIPDPLVFFDSDQTINHGVSRVNNLNHQFVDSDEEHALLYNDENITDNCSKDSWWVEAIRVADDIENKKNTVELSNMEERINDEDEEWWVAVESTASQAELNHFNCAG